MFIVKLDKKKFVSMSLSRGQFSDDSHFANCLCKALIVFCDFGCFGAFCYMCSFLGFFCSSRSLIGSFCLSSPFGSLCTFVVKILDVSSETPTLGERLGANGADVS